MWKNVINKFMKLVVEIIKFFIAGGLISAALVYLSKHFIDRFFARDLEKFKTDLEKEFKKILDIEINKNEK